MESTVTVTKESLSEALWSDAARFVERLLPGPCGDCLGDAHLSDQRSLRRDAQNCNCPTCHGTGQVWDEGLVEVVARVLVGLELSEWLGTYEQADTENRAWLHKQAGAVLAALAAEVGK